MRHADLKRVFRGVETKDGAGVRLRRIFGFHDTADLDPFLLLDAFGSKRPEDYIKGFPWHPHRGIETVTYLLDGSVRHGDSLGNSGVIGPGDLQWMTAGSGIIHEEMPQLTPGGVRGFQLWVNLAAAEKMCDPTYHGVVAAEVPVIPVPGGELRIMSGEWSGHRGPLSGIARNPTYFDLRLEPRASFLSPPTLGLTSFAFIYEGSLAPPRDEAATEKSLGLAPVHYGEGTCLLFREGKGIQLEAEDEGASIIWAAAPPLHEPVAWGGPIVMNTQEELEAAFRELDEGTFIRKAGRPA
jgi:redox-sensitive bicupin YhaK (pirin superfamily)